MCENCRQKSWSVFQSRYMFPLREIHVSAGGGEGGAEFGWGEAESAITSSMLGQCF